MSDGTFETESVSALHWVAVIFAAVTGLIHLGFGVSNITSPLGIAFVLAGLGYGGAIVLFLLNYRRQLLYAIGIPYVVIQIVLYVVINWPNIIFLADGSPFVIGIVDKTIQVVLVGILVILYRRA